MKKEKQTPLKAQIEFLEVAPVKIKRELEEEIYRRQINLTRYSVKGKDYKPKYDTGEEI